MNQKGFANIILVVVIVVLLGAVGYFAFVKKSEPIVQQPTPTPTQTNTSVSPTPIPSESYTYTVESVGGNSYDNKIVRTTNSSGKKEILLSSVRQAANLTRVNETLVEFAIPVNSNKIFLKQVLADTDDKSGLIWSFDVSAKQLTKLTNVNNAFDGFGGVVISPNKLFIVQAPDDEGKNDKGISQNLKLLDLNNDSVKTIVTLSGNETFNAGYGALSSHFDIKWLDNSKVRYNVYDQSRAPIQDGRYFNGTESYKPLIATRTVTVK